MTIDIKIELLSVPLVFSTANGSRGPRDKLVFFRIVLDISQISTDGYYHFEIGNMKSLQDWIVYMLPIEFL